MSEDLRIVREDVWEHRARLMEEMQQKRRAAFPGTTKEFYENWRERAVQGMIVENRVKSQTYKV